MNKKILSIVKFICLIYMVVLIPRVVSFCSKSSTDKANKNLYVLLGVENLIRNQHQYKDLKQLRIGLLCHSASVDQLGKRSVDLLVDNGFSVKKMFVLSDGQEVWRDRVFPSQNGIDIKTRVPITFIKKNRCLLPLRCFNGIDALFVDVQERGIRVDDSVDFLFSVMKMAVRTQKKLIILDRPNPLAGIIEGPGEIPWRYGLTIGELAYYYNNYKFKKPTELTVIPLVRWRRSWALYSIPFVPRFSWASSLASYQSSSFLLPLHEVKPISIKERSGELSQVITLPEIEKLSVWEMRYLKRLCWELGLHCGNYSYNDSNTKEKRDGVKIYIKTDINKFSAFNTLLTFVRFFKNRKQITLSFSDKFDSKVASGEVKRFLEGTIGFDVFKKNIEKSIYTFYDKAKHCCLYKPLPSIVKPELIKG